jgi:iron complex outermembrane receptor protein
MPQISSLALFALAVSGAGPALADSSADPHGPAPTDIIVSAPLPRQRMDTPTAVSILAGEALARSVRMSIGETLARQPGVSSTWFGPGASRPVLRGMQDERVRVLTDGIGSFDVSNTSVDHAVAINPLLAERVEVIRGPSALLYGSSAIGGVVNVLDRRIPRALPAEALHLDARGGYGSASEERSAAAAMDVPVAQTGLVAHADGSWLKSGDLHVGGPIFAPELRATAHAIGGPTAEAADASGRMPNTNARTWDAAGGLAWFGDGGTMGFAVSRLESNYGIPDTLDLVGVGADNGVRIDMRQTRVDARAELPLAGALRQLKFRFGWADYAHSEIEGDGAIGTTFVAKGLEARLELVQERRGIWQGATGAQLLSRDFDAIGTEAYIPRNHTEQLGLFTLQQFDIGSWKAEVGARYEHASVRAPAVAFQRSYDSVSGSAGLSVPLADGWHLAGSVAYSQRAPSAEELLSDGAHVATRSFQVGSRRLGLEKSLGLEAVLRGRGEGYRLELSGFYTRFYDFIWFGRTGAIEDGLPVYQAAQQGARFRGFEADAGVTLFEWGGTVVELTGMADHVRADLTNDGGPVPRIPPMRFLGGVEASGGALEGRFEVEHALAQKRTAPFETATPAFTLVNLSLSWHPPGLDRHSASELSANNIFDAIARRHASYLKDEAPLPGRDIRLGRRVGI